MMLSIVIPTRNRQEYAIKTIEQVYLTVKDAQIVIQDNSDKDSLETMLGIRFSSSRIKYQYIQKRLTGVENYAAGISNADGEYICCIGDDDGVFSYITDIVSVMEAKGINALRSTTSVVYLWPNVSHHNEVGCIKTLLGDDLVRSYDTRKQLTTLFSNGCQEYLSFQLAKAYHGIIRRSFFNDIFTKTGKFCGGLSPDIYLSVSLSHLIGSVTSIGIPVTIGGVCNLSTSADVLNKRGLSSLEDAPHLIGQSYSWSQFVPRLYCDETIWADSALHAANELEIDYLSFDQMSLISKCIYKCLLYNKLDEFRGILLNHLVEHGGTKNEYSKLETTQRGAMYIGKVRNFLKKAGIRRINSVLIKNLGDIIVAEKECRSLYHGLIESTLDKLSQ